jgi:hypothetical protein
VQHVTLALYSARRYAHANRCDETMFRQFEAGGRMLLGSLYRPM